MILDQKSDYSDPINVHLDHSSWVPGSARDDCFGSQVSPIIRAPGPTFKAPSLESRFPRKIKVPDLDSRVRPMRWVSRLGSHQTDMPPPEVFCKKGFFKNFAKFTGKHLCQSLFFNKVSG